MNKIDFTKLTLRDLGMLVGLVTHKRIAPVAHEFRVSASAVSYALDRLRGALGDELLIRTHREFKPTPEARAYAQQAKRFLEQMQEISDPLAFDPASAETRFTFVATEYETLGPMRNLIPNILAAGPGLGVNIIQTSRSLSIDRLHEDIDIAFLPESLGVAGIEEEILFHDPYKVFFDPAFPLEAGLDAFCELRHGLVDSTGRGHTNVDERLARLGRSRNVAVVAPSFPTLAQIMRGSPMITTLPAGFSDGLFAGFATIDPPLELLPMPVHLCYARSRKSEPKLQWLLEQVHRARPEQAV